MTKAIQEARRNRDNAAVKSELGKFDAALAKYIPVLMGQAKIYWDMENYGQVTSTSQISLRLRFRLAGGFSVRPFHRLSLA